jgi:hypothetical protein
VVLQQVGEGWLLAVATDEFFENAWLVSRRKGLLAVRLLERARRAGGAVAIDESLSASGPPRVFGLLMSEAVRPVTLQVVAVFILLAWAGSRVFGAPREAERTARRQITEHALALGQLHQRTATAGTPVGSYLEYFRHELGLGRQGASGVALLATRARLDPARLSLALERASRAVEAARVPARVAAACVRELAEIKRRIEHPS